MDSGKNPHYHTRAFTEQAAGENAWNHAKVLALDDFGQSLTERIIKIWPELNKELVWRRDKTSYKPNPVIVSPKKQQISLARNPFLQGVEGSWPRYFS